MCSYLQLPQLCLNLVFVFEVGVKLEVQVIVHLLQQVLGILCISMELKRIKRTPYEII